MKMGTAVLTGTKLRYTHVWAKKLNNAMYSGKKILLPLSFQV